MATKRRRTDAAAGRGENVVESKRATDEDPDGAGSREPGPDGVCPVAFCPICTAVSVVNRASPDVVHHLLVAGQQFLLALKAVVDARAADFEDPGAKETPIQRIDIV
jgi:hypothetical protein